MLYRFKINKIVILSSDWPKNEVKIISNYLAYILREKPSQNDPISNVIIIFFKILQKMSSPHQVIAKVHLCVHDVQIFTLRNDSCI